MKIPGHFIVLLVLLFPVLESLEIRMKLQQMSCFGNPPQNVTCSWKQPNDTFGTATVDLFTPYQLDTAQLHVQLFHKSSQKGSFRPFIIDTVQDFCAFTREGNLLVQLSEMITKDIRSYFYNTHCPLGPGHMGLRDMPINVEKTAEFFPTGDYRLNITIWGNSKIISRISATSRIIIHRKRRKG